MFTARNISAQAIKIALRALSASTKRNPSRALGLPPSSPVRGRLKGRLTEATNPAENTNDAASIANTVPDPAMATSAPPTP